MRTRANIEFILRSLVSGGLFWILLTYIAGTEVAVSVLLLIIFVLWVEEA
jgi:hypothetical protein